MGILRTLFARVVAKVKLIAEYKQLVIDIHKQEQTVEALRLVKEERKSNAALYDATLYLSKKDSGDKVTEAYLKALIETDEGGQAKRVSETAAEHDYKLGMVELTNLYNRLQSVKLELTA